MFITQFYPDRILSDVYTIKIPNSKHKISNKVSFENSSKFSVSKYIATIFLSLQTNFFPGKYTLIFLIFAV